MRHGSRLYKLGFENLTEAEIKCLSEEDFPEPKVDITSSRESHRNTKLN